MQAYTNAICEQEHNRYVPAVPSRLSTVMHYISQFVLKKNVLQPDWFDKKAAEVNLFDASKKVLCIGTNMKEEELCTFWHNLEQTCIFLKEK